MSLWFRTKDDQGRPHQLGVDVPWEFLLAVLGVGAVLVLQLAAMPAERAGRIFLGVCVVGFVALAVARLSVIARGRLVSFGSAAITPTMRRLYWLGWALVVVGVVGGMMALLRL